MSAASNVTHPSCILDHIVRVVLPARCQSSPSDAVTEYYKEQLDDPKAAIAQCKAYVASWVQDLFEAGSLRDCESLEQQVVDIPSHGVIYLIVLIVDDKPWYYVGQSKNGRARVVSGHWSETYRDSNPSFLYYLWKHASKVFCCLPVSDASLTSGPIMNILEQWLSVVFLALQPLELRENLAPEAIRQIPLLDMQNGVGRREPLAQPFCLWHYPMKHDAFIYSSQPRKVEYYQWKQQQVCLQRREKLLQGDLYTGAFTNGFYNKGDIDVYFGGFQFPVPSGFLNRIVRETFRIQCILVPVGEQHFHTIIGGMRSPAKYDDPARRLGIRYSGLRACDNVESFMWLYLWEHNGDLWIPKLNRLVDWLEDRDLDEVRPRRFYWAERAQGTQHRGYFTRHPADFEEGNEEWKTLLNFEELE